MGWLSLLGRILLGTGSRSGIGRIFGSAAARQAAITGNTSRALMISHGTSMSSLTRVSPLSRSTLSLGNRSLASIGSRPLHA